MTNEEAISVLSANVMFACDRALFDIATKRCVEDALDKAIDALEKQKTGKWIQEWGVVDEKTGKVCWKDSCSECGNFGHKDMNYYPHCGSRMLVDEEDEDEVD